MPKFLVAWGIIASVTITVTGFVGCGSGPSANNSAGTTTGTGGAGGHGTTVTSSSSSTSASSSSASSSSSSSGSSPCTGPSCDPGQCGELSPTCQTANAHLVCFIPSGLAYCLSDDPNGVCPGLADASAVTCVDQCSPGEFAAECKLPNMGGTATVPPGCHDFVPNPFGKYVVCCPCNGTIPDGGSDATPCLLSQKLCNGQCVDFDAGCP